MEEHQRIHEGSQAAGKHQHDDRRQDGELQLTPFEMIQLFAVQRPHDVSLAPDGLWPRVRRVSLQNEPLSSGERPLSATHAEYCVAQVVLPRLGSAARWTG